MNNRLTGNLIKIMQNKLSTLVVLGVVVFFFNKDKVMCNHRKPIPAIDTWCIRLQALLTEKPVTSHEPALLGLFIFSSATQSLAVLRVCNSSCRIKVAHNDSLFQPRPVELHMQ